MINKNNHNNRYSTDKFFFSVPSISIIMLRNNTVKKVANAMIFPKPDIIDAQAV